MTETAVLSYGTQLWEKSQNVTGFDSTQVLSVPTKTDIWGYDIETTLQYDLKYKWLNFIFGWNVQHFCLSVS